MTRGYERFSLPLRVEDRDRSWAYRAPADGDGWDREAPSADGIVADTRGQALDHAQALAEALGRTLAVARALSLSADRADDDDAPSRGPDAHRPPESREPHRHTLEDDEDDWPASTPAARSWFRGGPLAVVKAPSPRAPIVAPATKPKELPSPDRQRFPLFPAARLVLLYVAGALPVLSIPLQVFDILPLAVTAQYVVLPLTLAAAVVMLGPSVQGAWAVQGLIAGLLAVTAYDALRIPLAVAGVIPDFIPQVGGWVLNSDSPNVVVGYLWRYLGDGGGIGISFFVTCGVVLSFRPEAIRRSPIALSIAYGIFIWSGLIATIALSESGASLLFALTPLTLAVSLAGHLVYGGVLGLWLRHVLADEVVAAWPGPPLARPIRSRAGDKRNRRPARRDQRTSAAWVTIPPHGKAGSVNVDSEGRWTRTRAGDVDGALRVAIEHGDVAAYVNALFSAVVIVPTIRDASDTVELRAPSVSWRLSGQPQALVIEAFTSVEVFERAAPPPKHGDTMRFPDLLADWPGGGYGLAINPGTPLGMLLRDEQVQMLRRWLPDPQLERVDTKASST
jgi:hypothetical protein